MKLFDRFFKKPYREKDDVWSRMEILKNLRRNGVITERAILQRRSLSGEERNIIYAIREIAKSKGFSQKMIVAEEFDGQVDKKLVYEPYKVTARFAYYQSAYYGHSVADASFIVMESNHPVLIQHGNFGEEELRKYNIKVPKHPTFEEWDRKGRRCYRGQ